MSTPIRICFGMDGLPLGGAPATTFRQLDVPWAGPSTSSRGECLFGCDDSRDARFSTRTSWWRTQSSQTGLCKEKSLASGNFAGKSPKTRLLPGPARALSVGNRRRICEVEYKFPTGRCREKQGIDWWGYAHAVAVGMCSRAPLCWAQDFRQKLGAVDFGSHRRIPSIVAAGAFGPRGGSSGRAKSASLRSHGRKRPFVQPKHGKEHVRGVAPRLGMYSKDETYALCAPTSSGRVVGRVLALPAPGAPLGALMSFNELEQHQHRGRPVTMAFYHLQRHDLALGIVE